VDDMGFGKQLEKQLRYIENSARAYDAGDAEEAIRIATSLRVIFHQTRQSTSLLSHLRATYARMMTSVPKPPYPQEWFSPLANISAMMYFPEPHRKECPNYEASRFVSPLTYKPLLSSASLTRAVSGPDWWSAEPVIILHKKKSTRKDIVLWAANKDGGAHVDAQLPFDYVHLSNCIRLGAASDPTAEMTTETAKNAPFALLRQMAHEALNSPDLLKLAGR
jgi:hypothetical protein